MYSTSGPNNFRLNDSNLQLNSTQYQNFGGNRGDMVSTDDLLMIHKSSKTPFTSNRQGCGLLITSKINEIALGKHHSTNEYNGQSADNRNSVMKSNNSKGKIMVLKPSQIIKVDQNEVKRQVEIEKQSSPPKKPPTPKLS